MESQTLKCGVNLPGAPSRLLYVPPQEEQNATTKTVFGCYCWYCHWLRRPGRKGVPAHRQAAF